MPAIIAPGADHFYIKLRSEWRCVSLEIITLVTSLHFLSNLYFKGGYFYAKRLEWPRQKPWPGWWRSSTRRENLRFKEMKKCWRSQNGDWMVTFSCGPPPPPTRIWIEYGGILCFCHCSSSITLSLNIGYVRKGSGHTHASAHARTHTHETRRVSHCVL